MNCQRGGACLQTSIDCVWRWCNKNGMFLNVSKCQIISFSRKRELFTYDYQIGGDTLSRVEVIKDLGVWFDSKMTFKHHMDATISRANSMLGLIKRFGKEFSDPYVIKVPILFFSSLHN